MPCRVLIACVGNIFLGDDAFGVEVAGRLRGIDLPEGVRAVDFGIRGLDLAYALADGCESLILVDAVPRGGAPGTLYVMELPTVHDAQAAEGTLMGGHNLHPVHVLQHAACLGARVERPILVGCEPQPADESDDFGTGLSAPVASAVDAAVPLIVSLATKLLRGEEIAASADLVPLQEGN